MIKIETNRKFFDELSKFNPALSANLRNKYGWTDILVKRRDDGSLSQRSGQHQRIEETSFNSKN